MAPVSRMDSPVSTNPPTISLRRTVLMPRRFIRWSRSNLRDPTLRSFVTVWLVFISRFPRLSNSAGQRDCGASGCLVKQLRFSYNRRGTQCGHRPLQGLMRGDVLLVYLHYVDRLIRVNSFLEHKC